MGDCSVVKAFNEIKQILGIGVDKNLMSNLKKTVRKDDCNTCVHKNESINTGEHCSHCFVLTSSPHYLRMETPTQKVVEINGMSCEIAVYTVCEKCVHYLTTIGEGKEGVCQKCLASKGPKYYVEAKEARECSRKINSCLAQQLTDYPTCKTCLRADDKGEPKSHVVCKNCLVSTEPIAYINKNEFAKEAKNPVSEKELAAVMDRLERSNASRVSRSQLHDSIKKSCEAIPKLFDYKNADYGQQNDAFANFRKTAERIVQPFMQRHGVTVGIDEAMFLVMQVLQDKHLVALSQTGLSGNEIAERLRDIANYALIQEALYEAVEGNKKDDE